MIRQSPRALIGLVVSLACSPALCAQQGPTQPVPELLEGVALLFESVFDQDAAGIDAATCLPDLLQAQLNREAALSLIVDASAPDLIEARGNQVRTDVIAFVERLFDQGEFIESVDTSRVVFADPEKAESETVIGASGDALAITASGVLGIKMTSAPRAVDVGVYRLGDRWCIDPLSMQ